MTKRERELKSYNDFITALQDMEKKRPKGSMQNIYSETGGKLGTANYSPADDLLILEIDHEIIKLRGDALCSIYQFLQELFAPAEE